MSLVYPLIYWDAGHGYPDPGAVKYEKEADLTIKVVKYAVAYMNKTYKCRTYQDISSDSLNTIVKRANAMKAKLFVSVHFNAGGGDGYEALVYSIGNLKLGRCFEKHVKAIGQNSRGVKYRPDLAVLRDTNMKSILNEIAFVDNLKDIRDWNDPAELKKMGEELAKAAAEYLGLKKKSTKTTTKKPAVVDCKDFKVEVIVNSLKIRKTPEIKDNNVVGSASKGVYTIVKTTKDGTWGLLKTYAKDENGWIRILDKYAKRIK